MKRRSTCPINACAEILGDRWSLIVIRDLMMRGYRTYKELASCDEGIATNILADRLAKLEADGIITSEADPEDGRRSAYRLTEKGIDLAPVLQQLGLWAVKHEAVRASPAVVALMKQGRFVGEARKRWTSRSREPIIPRAGASR